MAHTVCDIDKEQKKKHLLYFVYVLLSGQQVCFVSDNKTSLSHTQNPLDFVFIVLCIVALSNGTICFN